MRPFLVLLALLAWQPLDAQQVQVYLTSQAGDRIAPKPALRFAARAPGGGAVFRIHEEAAFQRIDGFGASLLEAGLICLNSLDPPEQEKVLRTLFDARSGSGFSAMKTVLAGTDFMSAGPWYTYDDTPGDVELKHFSIARDLGPNGEVTFIKRARRYGQFALQAPMDYPPDWMLFDVHKNQDVDPRYFEVLAHYYLRYLRAYEEQGILIDYLSLFNEPGVYTKIPYTKIRDLLKNHVGPLFAREGQNAHPVERGAGAAQRLAQLSHRAGRSGGAQIRGRGAVSRLRLQRLRPDRPVEPALSRATVLDDGDLLCVRGRLQAYPAQAAAGGLRGRRFLGKPDLFRPGGRGFRVDLLEPGPGREGRPVAGFTHPRQPGSERAAPRGDRESRDQAGDLYGAFLLPEPLQQVRASGGGARGDHGFSAAGSRNDLSRAGRQARGGGDEQPPRAGADLAGVAGEDAGGHASTAVDRHVSMVRQASPRTCSSASTRLFSMRAHISSRSASVAMRAGATANQVGSTRRIRPLRRAVRRMAVPNSGKGSRLSVSRTSSTPRRMPLPRTSRTTPYFFNPSRRAARYSPRPLAWRSRAFSVISSMTAMPTA